MDQFLAAVNTFRGWRNIVRSQHGVDTPVVTDVELEDEVPSSKKGFCGPEILESVDTQQFCATYPSSCHTCPVKA